jgi:hypothetical protein
MGREGGLPLRLAELEDVVPDSSIINKVRSTSLSRSVHKLMQMIYLIGYGIPKYTTIDHPNQISVN